VRTPCHAENVDPEALAQFNKMETQMQWGSPGAPATGARICQIHKKIRGMSCLECDGDGGFICRPGKECNPFGDEDQSAADPPDDGSAQKEWLKVRLPYKPSTEKDISWWDDPDERARSGWTENWKQREVGGWDDSQWFDNSWYESKKKKPKPAEEDVVTSLLQLAEDVPSEAVQGLVVKFSAPEYEFPAAPTASPQQPMAEESMEGGGGGGGCGDGGTDDWWQDGFEAGIAWAKGAAKGSASDSSDGGWGKGSKGGDDSWSQGSGDAWGDGGGGSAGGDDAWGDGGGDAWGSGGGDSDSWGKSSKGKGGDGYGKSGDAWGKGDDFCGKGKGKKGKGKDGGKDWGKAKGAMMADSWKGDGKGDGGDGGKSSSKGGGYIGNFKGNGKRSAPYEQW